MIVINQENHFENGTVYLEILYGVTDSNILPVGAAPLLILILILTIIIIIKYCPCWCLSSSSSS